MPRLRRDPLTGRLTLVAPGRAGRPRSFVRSVVRDETQSCPFCPGNEAQTPPARLQLPPAGAWEVRVFGNRWPALRDGEVAGPLPEALLSEVAAGGCHEVIVQTPLHEETLGGMPDGRRALVLQACLSRLAAASEAAAHAQLFQNHGGAAGASLAHAHAQLVALGEIPPLASHRVQRCEAHHAATGRCLLCDVAAAEREGPRRLGGDDAFDLWLAFAPSRAWELWLAPRRHVASLRALSPAELSLLSLWLGRALRALDRALDRPGWNLLFHEPPRGASPDAFHAYLELSPALGRGAGFEHATGAAIVHVAPETAAATLRESLA